MADQESIVDRVNELVAEQDRLRENDPDDGERRRIDAIESELNQCWDLLRQRRAKADAGEDPDEAEVRDPDTVDTYLN